MKELLSSLNNDSFKEWEALFSTLHSPKVFLDSHQVQKKRLAQVFERKRFYKAAFEEYRKENIMLKERIEKMSEVISEISEENRISNEQLYSYKATEEDDTALRHEIETMRQENQRELETNGELQSLVNRLQEEKKSCLDQISNIQFAYDETSRRIVNVEKLYNECQIEKDIILVEKQSLKDQLDTSISEVSSLKSQILLSEEKGAELAEEIKCLRLLLDDLRTEKSRDSQCILDLENLSSTLHLEIASKATTIVDLNSAIARSKTDWLDQEKCLQSDITQLKDALRHRQNEMDIANDRASKVRDFVDHIEQAASMLSSGGTAARSNQYPYSDDDEIKVWNVVVDKLNQSVLESLKEKETLMIHCHDTDSKLKSMEMQNHEKVERLNEKIDSLKSALEEMQGKLDECRYQKLMQEDSHKVAVGILDAQISGFHEEMERLKVELIAKNTDIIALNGKLSAHDIIAKENLKRVETELQTKLDEVLSLKPVLDIHSQSKDIVMGSDGDGLILTTGETVIIEPRSKESTGFPEESSLNMLAHNIVDDYVGEALGRLPHPINEGSEYT